MWLCVFVCADLIKEPLVKDAVKNEQSHPRWFVSVNCMDGMLVHLWVLLSFSTEQPSVGKQSILGYRVQPLLDTIPSFLILILLPFPLIFFFLSTSYFPLLGSSFFFFNPVLLFCFLSPLLSQVSFWVPISFCLFLPLPLFKLCFYTSIPVFSLSLLFFVCFSISPFWLLSYSSFHHVP